jgi:hypothetical protein
VAVAAADLSEAAGVPEGGVFGLSTLLGEASADGIFRAFFLALEDEGEAFEVGFLEQLLNGFQDGESAKTAQVDYLAGLVHSKEYIISRRINLLKNPSFKEEGKVGEMSVESRAWRVAGFGRGYNRGYGRNNENKKRWRDRLRWDSGSIR